MEYGAIAHLFRSRRRVNQPTARHSQPIGVAPHGPTRKAARKARLIYARPTIWAQEHKRKPVDCTALRPRLPSREIDHPCCLLGTPQCSFVFNHTHHNLGRKDPSQCFPGLFLGGEPPHMFTLTLRPMASTIGILNTSPSSDTRKIAFEGSAHHTIQQPISVPMGRAQPAAANASTTSSEFIVITTTGLVTAFGKSCHVPARPNVAKHALICRVRSRKHKVLWTTCAQDTSETLAWMQPHLDG
jgi:hypothetical protein